jgi:hypothetical protein
MNTIGKLRIKNFYFGLSMQDLVEEKNQLI